MSKKKTTLKRDRTPFEWTILAVSIAAIVAIAAGLVFYALTLKSGPADLRTTVAPSSGDELVVTVENLGTTTAEEVVVDVKRGRQTQEVIFRAVAKGDSEEATVKMAGGGKATAEVVAYKEP